MFHRSKIMSKHLIFSEVISPNFINYHLPLISLLLFALISFLFMLEAFLKCLLNLSY